MGKLLNPRGLRRFQIGLHGLLTTLQLCDGLSVLRVLGPLPPDAAVVSGRIYHDTNTLELLVESREYPVAPGDQAPVDHLAFQVYHVAKVAGQMLEAHAEQIANQKARQAMVDDMAAYLSRQPVSPEGGQASAGRAADGPQHGCCQAEAPAGGGHDMAALMGGAMPSQARPDQTMNTPYIPPSEAGRPHEEADKVTIPAWVLRDSLNDLRHFTRRLDAALARAQR